MFATVFTMKLHKFKLKEFFQVGEEMKKKLPQTPYEGICDAMVLVDHQSDKVVKIVLWESEEHALHALNSGIAHEAMHQTEHFLAEPLKIETFDTALTMKELAKV